MKKIISFENLQGIVLGQEGLSLASVIAQQKKFGRNEIVEDFAQPWWAILIETLKDPMVALLAVAGSMFLFLDNYSEAITLYVAILPLLAMNLYLHHRTQASTRVLKAQINRSVWVWREGRKIEIDSLDLVPGDRVLLKTGDYLAADGFFESTDKLLVDESILTGESLPLKKDFLHQGPPANLLTPVSVPSEALGFAGTRVVRGDGVLRVLAIGPKTEYGTILQTLSDVPQQKTALQIDIARLVKTLTFAGFVCCLLLAAVRLYQGKGWLDAILSAAILAVAAMPEEFPIVFSFFLGVGVYRLAKENALVRRAVTVENIGQVECICTDKTGTITLGELQVVNVKNASGISKDLLLEGALMASEEFPTDPVDIAISRFANSVSSLTKLCSFPFTELRKKESAIYQRASGEVVCAVKGAPEIIFDLCAMPEEERKHWKQVVLDWSGNGEKVLAFAQRALGGKENTQTEPSSGFTFGGLLGFSDPLRPEVRGAMEYCRQHGIKVIMLTGDHPQTAAAIATQAGMVENTPRVLSMEETDLYKTKEDIQSRIFEIAQYNVIARCNPLQKVWIVEALKTQGKVVAVTGDGVNDVPALQRADIGIAMGKRGARAAREVSAIILADDNFATIVKAIREGKQLLKNLNVSFEYLLFMQIPLVLGAAIIPLVGYPLLFLPVHLVWMELILHPTSLLAFQLPVAGDGNKSTLGDFFNRKKLFLISFDGLLILLIMIASFRFGIGEEKGAGHARANALVILCLASVVFVLRKTFLGTKASAWIFILTLFSTVILVQIPWLSQQLSLQPLDFFDWVRAFTLVFVAALASEFISRRANTSSAG
ncbi:cation-transporting P-type ATPase [Bdellovibrio sp. ArHS]|uniref:cation-translocating P-type ATPase n=1 Tax=Bdellovibrio sp. ArHS TaxID=1569284 RepID=UPI000A5D9C8A|nr:cation-transporting P-type ATPase [Bdellovibrio sp. ArHS]